MTHKFKVRDMCQSASGVSHIVKFSGQLLVQPGTGIVTLHVLNTVPEVVSDQLLNQSLEYIRLGAADVLTEQQLDGVLTLLDLVIHDVDCRPFKFRDATSRAIRGLGTLS